MDFIEASILISILRNVAAFIILGFLFFVSPVILCSHPTNHQENVE